MQFKQKFGACALGFRKHRDETNKVLNRGKTSPVVFFKEKTMKEKPLFAKEKASNASALFLAAQSQFSKVPSGDFAKPTPTTTGAGESIPQNKSSTYFDIGGYKEGNKKSFSKILAPQLVPQNMEVRARTPAPADVEEITASWDAEVKPVQKEKPNDRYRKSARIRIHSWVSAKIREKAKAEKAQRAGRGHGCKKVVLGSECSQGTVLVRDAFSRHLVQAMKARTLRTIKTALNRAKHPEKRILAFFERKNHESEICSCIPINAEALRIFEAQTGSGKFLAAYKSFLVDCWLDSTVRPLLKSKTLLVDQLDDGHTQFPTLIRITLGKDNLFECRSRTADFCAFEEIVAPCDSRGESTETVKNLSFYWSWEEFWLGTKMKHFFARISQWLQKVRPAAICRSTCCESASESRYGQNLDKNWDGDFSPMLYYAADNNSDCDGEQWRTKNQLICGRRLIPSSSSLCFSEDAPEEHQDTDDTGSMASWSDYSDIRVITASGEIVTPSSIGILKQQCRRRPALAHSVVSSLHYTDPRFFEKLDERQRKRDIVIDNIAASLGVSMEKVNADLAKRYAHEAAIIKAQAEKAAAQYDLELDDLYLRLENVVMQFAEGKFDVGDSQLSIKGRLIKGINDEVKASCKRLQCLRENAKSNKTLPHLPSSDENPPQTTVLQETSKKPPICDMPAKNPPQLVVPGPEEVLKPAISAIVSNCSQGFMKELKLVTKFFGQADLADEDVPESKYCRLPENSNNPDTHEHSGMHKTLKETKPGETPSSAKEIFRGANDYCSMINVAQATIQDQAFSSDSTDDTEALKLDAQEVKQQNESDFPKNIHPEARGQPKLWWDLINLHSGTEM